jgi:hypothetical protein
MVGKWTPSQCKSATANTTAQVDAAVTASVTALNAQVKDTTTCKDYYGKNGCDKVKATADCSWACAHAAMTAQTTYGCGSATVCATNNGVQLPKCSSMTDMFTAICDKTADEITKIVADGKTAGRCSDTGAAFSLPAKATTAAPASTPKPASAGLLSATWAMVLTAPVISYALLV